MSEMRRNYPYTACYSRLRVDLAEVLREPLDLCDASPRNDNLLKWAVVLQGPPHTPYASGIFFVDITFTDDFPFRAPKVYFRTRIFHCNVRETGEWVTGDWRSSMSVRDLLSNLSASLRLNSEVAEFAVTPHMRDLFVDDRPMYDHIARDHTRRFAA